MHLLHILTYKKDSYLGGSEFVWVANKGQVIMSIKHDFCSVGKND